MNLNLRRKISRHETPGWSNPVARRARRLPPSLGHNYDQVITASKGNWKPARNYEGSSTSTALVSEH